MALVRALHATTLLRLPDAIELSSVGSRAQQTTLGEMLATSDLPGGVVNLLTGQRRELIPTFSSHAHLRAISAVASAEERKAIGLSGSHRAAAAKPSRGRIAGLLGRGRK